MKIGEWYYVKIPIVVYSVPWDSKEQWTEQEIGADVPFLLLSVSTFNSETSKLSYDLKILVDRNIGYLSINEDKVSGLCQIT